MTKQFSLTIDQVSFTKLHDHLFPGDGDEHGAIIAAGIVESSRGARLLAREIFLAVDGLDYIPGKRGYRALTAEFIANVSDYCARENLCYLAVHCHGGLNRVGFSEVDLASHQRGYPALLDIIGGGPVGALVFAEEAVAGDIWTPQGRFELEHLTVIGSRIKRLYPSPVGNPTSADPVFDRHARLFGDLGQSILSGLKVGIIGLGGGGSLLNEWLTRLGVGHIVAIDFDRVDLTNLPRIVGSTRLDALTFLTGSPNKLLQKIGKRFARHKVYVARRIARQANPKIHYDAVVGSILDEKTALLLKDVDFLFLASDTIQSRLVFNALVQQYLIPGVQVGVKVQADKTTGKVGTIHAATRPVLPFPGGGCLMCNGLIPAGRLREEALNEEELRGQRYVESTQVVAPSVITLNVISAAQAANDLMMMFTGLYDENVLLDQHLWFIREREVRLTESAKNDTCLECSTKTSSRRARGDRERLPCKSG